MYFSKTYHSGQQVVLDFLTILYNIIAPSKQIFDKMLKFLTFVLYIDIFMPNYYMHIEQIPGREISRVSVRLFICCAGVPLS